MPWRPLKARTYQKNIEDMQKYSQNKNRNACLNTQYETMPSNYSCVTIHPHFSLPPQLSPTLQQYQHQHQHQHLPSMSLIQQHQLPVTPPPLTPDIIRHNPWRINEQSCHLQRQNQALGLFFHSWTPRPCSDPLCRAPHQQPRPLQITCHRHEMCSNKSTQRGDL